MHVAASTLHGYAEIGKHVSTANCGTRFSDEGKSKDTGDFERTKGDNV
jgi:hypothetical protein